MAADRPPPVWPTVVGVVSMVLAAQALLGIVRMLIQLGLAVLDRGPRALRPASLFGGIGGWWAVGAAYQALRSLLGVLLLAGGWTLLRRGRFGPRLLLIYAVLAILLALTLPLGYFLGRHSMPVSGWMLLFSWLWQTTLDLIYPVFLLIWLRRAAIRRQTAAWP